MALDFCRENSELFATWLKTSKLKLNFPFVCGFASEILYTYIKIQFPDTKIFLCDGNHKNDMVGMHTWIEIEEKDCRYIIDVSYFQYYDIDCDEMLICKKEDIPGTYFIHNIDIFESFTILSRLVQNNFWVYLGRIENSKNSELVRIISAWSKK